MGMVGSTKGWNPDGDPESHVRNLWIRGLVWCSIGEKILRGLTEAFLNHAIKVTGFDTDLTSPPRIELTMMMEKNPQQAGHEDKDQEKPEK
jgi:hypothetical protein